MDQMQAGKLYRIRGGGTDTVRGQMYRKTVSICTKRSSNLGRTQRHRPEDNALPI